jgi:hypothetical protein
MMMKATDRPTRSRLLLSVLASAAALLAAAPAVPAVAGTKTDSATQPMMPHEMKYEGIRYVTGGVGSSEAKAFEQMMDKYPLAIELVKKQKGVQHEAFTASAMVRISSHEGKQIFSAEAKGPYMLVDLAPGRYSMTATLNDVTLHKREFTVEKGKTTRETLVFPAEAG